MTPAGGKPRARRISASARASDSQQLTDLSYANRILYDQHILDAFGHVSVREANDPDRFLLSRNLAPAQVTSRDILEYDMEGTPMDDRGQRSYLERFIHAAIYRARPDVMAVVHSHSASLIPFGVTEVKFRPVSHMAGFIGEHAPIFEIRDIAGSSSNMLITDNQLGNSLAKVLGKHTVALMRGHGWVVVGDSIQQVVFRAVYADVNAGHQLRSMELGEINFLTPGEAAKTAAINDGQVTRTWDLWKARIGKIA